METILKYETGLDFLQSYYSFRKEKNSKFSYEMWSREIKYSHRSNLRLVCQGLRKISPLLESCLVNNLFKKQNEREYFRLLCMLSRVKNNLEEVEIKKRLILFKAKKERTINNSEDVYENLLESIYLFTLLGFDDLDKTTRSLAKKLNKSESDVTKILTKLEDQKMITSFIDSKGQTHWSALHQYSILADSHDNKLLSTFHKNSFLKAIESQKLPKSMRRFDSLIMALDEKDFANFSKDLQNFLDHQFYKYNKSKIKNKKLYQVQIGTFPVF